MLIPGGASGPPWRPKAPRANPPNLPIQSANLDDSFDPFSLKNQKQHQASSSSFNDDPFAPPQQMASSQKPSAPTGWDAFGSSTTGASATGASQGSTVDFDSVFGKPFTPSAPPPRPPSPARSSLSSAAKRTSAIESDPFATKNANFHKLPPNKTLQKSETVANVPAAGTKKKSVSSSLSR